MGILIKNGTIVDPANALNREGDILIEAGKIIRIEKKIPNDSHTLIDASGRIVAPGFIDLHAHLRQPGMEDAETIRSGSLAAARGGFTRVCCMPNTSPPIDNGGIVEYVISEARRVNVAKITPIGAITKGRLGKELAEIGELFEMGCCALSDDGKSVMDSAIMRRALEYTKLFNIPISSHCEDTSLAEGGVMHEGFVSTRLGLRGIPALAESSIVARDLALTELAGARIHIAHVSTAESVRLIREAKARGVRATAETCPHYFTLTDEAASSFDTNFKVNPPLRSREHLEAVIEGLKDGTIDAIATDHAPHPQYEKEKDFESAPFGIIGLETAFSLSLRGLVEQGHLSLDELVKKLSFSPARCFDLEGGTLSVGEEADITIIDLNREWVVKEEELLSRSHNSPFIGWTLKGQVITTICGGRVVYQNPV